MKIAVDGYELGPGARGVGRAIHNLLVCLFDLLPDDSFLIYTRESLGRYAHPRVTEQVLAPRRGYLTWQNGPLRRALRNSRPDLFIASNYVLPVFPPPGSVVFEHDISVVSHPEWYSRRYALTRKFLIQRSLKKAALVIVPSGFTKNEILAFFNLKPEKIAVLCYGVEEKFRRAPEADVLAWKEKKGVAGRKIIGFLGSLFKRRHLPSLVRATGLLRRDFPDLLLYVVGKDLSGLPRGEMAGILSAEGVRWDQELAEEELPFFYSAAGVFAYLSEYEGFGFPPLEALACGTPCVLLNRSSLQEVFEGMAFMADNIDDREVAGTLRRALTDEAEGRRQLNRFEERRTEFSWAKISRDFSRLLRGLEAGRGS